MRVPRHRPGRRHGVGWLGAGRILAGLTIGFTLMAVGLEVGADVLRLRDRPALVAGATRPELIPGVQVVQRAVPARARARPGHAPSRAGTPLSPSAQATPLRAAARPRIAAAVPVLEVVAGVQREVAAPQTRTALRDSDHDGLPDAVERRLGTDPHNADTDGDGIPDGQEDLDGLNTHNDVDATPDRDHRGAH